MKIKLRLLGLVCRLAFVFAVVPTALSVLSPAAQATTTADMVDSELKTLATKRDALGQEIETLSANLTLIFPPFNGHQNTRLKGESYGRPREKILL